MRDKKGFDTQSQAAKRTQITASTQKNRIQAISNSISTPLPPPKFLKHYLKRHRKYLTQDEISENEAQHDDKYIHSDDQYQNKYGLMPTHSNVHGNIYKSKMTKSRRISSEICQILGQSQVRKYVMKGRGEWEQEVERKIEIEIDIEENVKERKCLWGMRKKNDKQHQDEINQLYSNSQMYKQQQQPQPQPHTPLPPNSNSPINQQ